jgi:hypothetical protein
MSAPREGGDSLDRSTGAIPGCALDDAGLRAQRARYARLAPRVALLERQPTTLQLTFDEHFDRQTLESALATERRCCPFFQFELTGQRLRVTVDGDAYRPALDALAWAFEGARDAGASNADQLPLSASE